MDQRARIRVNLAQREVEIEGSEAFVERYAERISGLLDQFANDVLEGAEAPPAIAAAPHAAPTTRQLSVASFGEFLQHLPNAATDVDRILAAGYWEQVQARDDSFGTAEANRRLAEHGIKIGNPSQSVRQSLQAKRVFIVARGRFRVSQTGRDHLQRLMGDIVRPAPAGGTA